MSQTSSGIPLGGIIQLEATTNPDIHQKKLYVEYLDSTRLIGIDVETTESREFTFNDRGEFTDESITGLQIVYTPPEQGYAKLHGLVPNTWVNLHFTGDIPHIVVGRITNLEEDMIEVTPYQETDTRPLYIDFGYAGIPRHLGLQKIEIRWPPGTTISSSPQPPQAVLSDALTTTEIIETDEDNRPLNEVSSSQQPPLPIPTTIALSGVDEIGVEDMVFRIEVPEHEKRWDLNLQLHELTETWLTKQGRPTFTTLQHIHVGVSHFQRLRQDFTIYQNNGKFGGLRRPSNVTNVWGKSWLLPVTSQAFPIYLHGKQDEEHLFRQQEEENLEDVVLSWTDTRAYESQPPFQSPVIPSFAVPITNHQRITTLVSNSGEYDRHCFTAPHDIVTSYKTTQTYLRSENAAVTSLVVPPWDLIRWSWFHEPVAPLYQQIQTSVVQAPRIYQWLKTANIRQHHQETLDTPGLEKSNHHYIEYFPPDYNTATWTPWLKSLFPSVREAITTMTTSPIILGRWSMAAAIQTLRVLGITPDDITTDNATILRSYLLQEVESHRHQYQERVAKWKSTSWVSQTTTTSQVNAIERLFFGKNEWYEILKSAYPKSIGHHYTADTVLRTMLEEGDMGKLFFQLLTQTTLLLTAPGALLPSPTATVDASMAASTIKPCNRFLAKKYVSVEEMNRDKRVDPLYYDTELDKTPYEWLAPLTKERKIKSEPEFAVFLKEVLLRQHHVAAKEVDDLVTVLLEGKKRVQEGDYVSVVVYEEGVPHTTYYRRTKEKEFVVDPTMNDNMFFDDATFFCNIASKTIKSSIPQEKQLLQQQTQQVLKEEIGRRVDMTVEQEQQELEQKITKNMKLWERQRRIEERWRRIHEVHSNKLNYVLYQLGQQQSVSSNASTVETPVLPSPYESLIASIAAQSDIAKRAGDLLYVSARVTREALPSEKPYWRYCKRSNAPLIPISWIRIAEGYIRTHSRSSSTIQYSVILQQICVEYGTLSEDGSAYVDKYTGHFLCSLDYIDMDECDQQRGVVLSESIKLPSEVTPHVKTTPNHSLYTILERLCLEIGIPILEVEHTVIRWTEQVLQNIVPTPEKYATKYLKTPEDRKKNPPYEMFVDRTSVFVLTAAMICAIQTHTPPFPQKRVVDGCVFSFRGYPYAGDTKDLSMLKYMACVLFQCKSGDRPWNSFIRFDKAYIITQLKTFLAKEFVDRIPELRDRALQLVTTTATATTSITTTKWYTFLPPLYPFQLKDISRHTVASEWIQELYQQLQRGKSNHWTEDAILKIRYLSLSIVESIHRSVSNQTLLLQNPNGKPTRDNACCQDSPWKVWSYFSNVDPRIDEWKKQIESLEQAFRGIHVMERAPLFVDPTVTFPPTVVLEPSKENGEAAYRALVNWFHLDSDTPIPSDLQGIHATKPTQYNRNATWEEKLAFLRNEQHGWRLTESVYTALRQLVSRRNAVVPYALPKETITTRLQDAVDVLRDMASPLMTTPSSSDSKISTTPSVILRGLASFPTKDAQSEAVFLHTLSQTIERFQSGITSFLQFHHIQKDTVLIDEWARFQTFHCGTTETVTFLRESIRRMIRIYPNYVMNQVYSVSTAESKYDPIPLELRTQYQTPQIDILTTFASFSTTTMRNYWSHKDRENLVQEVTTMLDGLPLHWHHKDNITISMWFLVWYYVLYSLAQQVNQLGPDVPFVVYRQAYMIRPEEESVLRADISDDTEEGDETTTTVGGESVLNTNEIKVTIAKWIYTCFQAEQRHQSMMNITYDTVLKQMRQKRNSENKKNIDAFAQQSVDARYGEALLKKYKIGRWNGRIKKANKIPQLLDLDSEEEEEEDVNQQGTIGFDDDDDLVEDLVDLDNNE